MSDSSIRGNGKAAMYLISPLALILPIIAVTAYYGKFDLSGVSPVFTIGIGVIFLITACFHTSLCGRGKTKEAAALALAVNGTLLIFFSVTFESGILFDFFGFVTLIAGIITGMSAATPSGEPIFARKVDRILPNNVSTDEVRRIIESIQFPCVFMERRDDGSERVVAYNQPFMMEFNLDKGKILQNTLESLLQLEQGKTSVTHNGEEWIIKRTVRGRQILTMLSPAMRSKEAAKIEVFDAIDVSTGLYAAGFMKYKAKSDIESANRGKRRMSAALFKMSFPSDAPGLPDNEKKLAAAAMGQVIQAAIRVCDSAYRISDDEVLLMMPDTAKSGTKIVISRIYASIKRISAVECPSLKRAVVDSVDKDFIGGTDLPSYDKILTELLTLLYRQNPELASDVNADGQDQDK